MTVAAFGVVIAQCDLKLIVFDASIRTIPDPKHGHDVEIDGTYRNDPIKSLAEVPKISYYSKLVNNLSLN